MSATPGPLRAPAPLHRLASPFENLGSHYDAVVVGSGYGASIAASRLARAGQRVCVLERGREFQPGEYPDTTAEAAAQFQMDSEHGHMGSKTGLYDFHANEDIGVFIGCGLGGTSLVNAGVVLPAEPRVLADPVWPQVLRDDADGMRDGYARAAEMLRPASYPDDFPQLEKLVRARGGGRQPRRAVLPAPDQRQLRAGRHQPRRRLPAGLQAVRRLRQRLQLRRQEHADHELPPRRPESRRGDLHADQGAPRRAARRTLARALRAGRRRARRLRRAGDVRRRRHRRDRGGRARLDGDPAALARDAACRCRARSAPASAATATSSRSATTPTVPSTGSASATTTWASCRPSGRASPGSSTSASRTSWDTGS